MKSPIPFEGSWQRIERADAHRKAFAKAWNDFIDEDPYTVVSHMERNGTGAICIEPRNSTLPTVFAFELGEILYHLRAALDSIVYEAAIIDSGKSPPPNESHLYFPISDTATDFKKRSGDIAPLAKKRRDIVEGIQPYNAPKLATDLLAFNFNRALGILNAWAKKDRHRKLHFTGSWVSSASPKLRLPPGVTIKSMDVCSSVFLEKESKVASFSLSGYSHGMKVGTNPDLFIDIAVDEPPPPCSERDTLGNRIDVMIRAVQAVWGEFTKSY